MYLRQCFLKKKGRKSQNIRKFLIRVGSKNTREIS